MAEIGCTTSLVLLIDSRIRIRNCLGIRRINAGFWFLHLHVKSLKLVVETIEETVVGSCALVDFAR